MLPIKFFFALIIVALIGTVFILFRDRSFPQSVDPDTSSLTEVAGASDEPGPVIPAVSNSATGETAEAPATSYLDVQMLLENYCAKCHLTKKLELFRKSPSEWELTLEKMEDFGVHLDNPERTILINYLASE